MTVQPLFVVPEDESPELLSLELTEEELLADLMWPASEAWRDRHVEEAA